MQWSCKYYILKQGTYCNSDTNYMIMVFKAWLFKHIITDAAVIRSPVDDKYVQRPSLVIFKDKEFAMPTRHSYTQMSLHFFTIDRNNN